MGDGSPLVDYGIASQKRPKLLMAVSAAFGGLSGVGGTCVGVPPTLADEIRWESQVDEADIVDWTVAVSSGVLAGLIDAFYVGDFPLDLAGEWGKDTPSARSQKCAQAGTLVRRRPARTTRRMAIRRTPLPLRHLHATPHYPPTPRPRTNRPHRRLKQHHSTGLDRMSCPTGGGSHGHPEDEGASDGVGHQPLCGGHVRLLPGDGRQTHALRGNRVDRERLQPRGHDAAQGFGSR